jgi:hypothetical protein
LATHALVVPEHVPHPLTLRAAPQLSGAETGSHVLPSLEQKAVSVSGMHPASPGSVPESVFGFSPPSVVVEGQLHAPNALPSASHVCVPLPPAAHGHALCAPGAQAVLVLPPLLLAQLAVIVAIASPKSPMPNEYLAVIAYLVPQATRLGRGESLAWI